MDPDVALEDALSLAREMIDLAEHEIDTADAMRLSELLLGLDEFLSKGGFLPARWARGRA